MSAKIVKRSGESIAAEVVTVEGSSKNLAVRGRDSQTIEMTKALRHEYEAVKDLVVNFRRLARHTTVGSPQDAEQRESLRIEASVLAAAIKQTVPTVTWDWLCKILADEYAETQAKTSEDREKMRRYFKR
jgi:hypothetical protein